ncbi:unnamed protein product [Cuscuta epithymum]|uniref:Uncharacterized protein n=1 Tax=Cuscuta epithymum TaxID=186058 RepID=A0AAV0E820_9ASTE|nr:unnamed protein product [Cuscuta epithymum]
MYGDLDRHGEMGRDVRRSRSPWENEDLDAARWGIVEGITHSDRVGVYGNRDGILRCKEPYSSDDFRANSAPIRWKQLRSSATNRGNVSGGILRRQGFRPRSSASYKDVTVGLIQEEELQRRQSADYWGDTSAALVRGFQGRKPKFSQNVFRPHLLQGTNNEGFARNRGLVDSVKVESKLFSFLLINSSLQISETKKDFCSSILFNLETTIWLRDSLLTVGTGNWSFTRFENARSIKLSYEHNYCGRFVRIMEIGNSVTSLCIPEGQKRSGFSLFESKISQTINILKEIERENPNLTCQFETRKEKSLDELQMNRTNPNNADFSISDFLFQSDIGNLTWEVSYQSEKVTPILVMDDQFKHIQSSLLEIDGAIRELTDKWDQHQDFSKVLKKTHMDDSDKVSEQKNTLSNSSSTEFLLLQEFFANTIEEGMVNRAISKVGVESIEEFMHALDNDGVGLYFIFDAAADYLAEKYSDRSATEKFVYSILQKVAPGTLGLTRKNFKELLRDSGPHQILKHKLLNDHPIYKESPIYKNALLEPKQEEEDGFTSVVSRKDKKRNASSIKTVQTRYQSKRA